LKQKQPQPAYPKRGATLKPRRQRVLFALSVVAFIAFCLWRPDLWWVPSLSFAAFIAPWLVSHVADSWRRSKTIMTPTEFMVEIRGQRRTLRSRIRVFAALLHRLD
jgi:hypothetical protein